VVVGLVLPVAAVALGVPIFIALVVPSALVARHGDSDAELAGELSARVVDVVHGAPDLLAFGADGAALARIDELADRAGAAERRHARANALATLIVQGCQVIAVVGVLAVAVTAVHDGHLGPVMVAVLPLAVLGAFEPVQQVGHAVIRATAVNAAAARLLALDDVPVPVVDAAAPEEIGAGVVEVAFRDASLRYRDDLPLALDHLTATLAPGKRLAVTGSSGAGKSSVVSALLRYWPLTGGTLTVGGTDAGRLRQADIRARCAVVDQGAHLFAGTLRANLTLGRPDASDEELVDALAAAQLTEWVAGLPQGLETAVGDEGSAISGGERRRVAVARALVAGGDVLVLDEPTNGLQAALADQLIDDVLVAAGERSVLLVTHRVAEAQRCDTTLTLENGGTVA
jgi:ATP-binding cassette subfamily C protein CydC